jgi:hypothetical protein
MAHIHTLENGEVIIRDDWGTEDVLSVADCMEVKLTPAQVTRVMDIVVESFDATVGINWDSFEMAIDLVLGDKNG